MGIPVVPLLASFRQRVLCLGSCFAETIYRNLGECGFAAYYDRSSTRHFSVSTILDKLIRLEAGHSCLADSEILPVQGGGGVASRRHPLLVAPDPEALRRLAEAADAAFADQLRQADVVVYTTGTSTHICASSDGSPIYDLTGLDVEWTEVSGCYSDMVADLRALFTLLQRLCKPTCRFVVTVSPQRYSWQAIAHGEAPQVADQWDDGLVSNTYDKAKQRVAVQEVLQEIAAERFNYFPSYEIVLEELRGREVFDFDHLDFRHISAETKNYVANRFLSHFATESVRSFLEAFNEFRHNVATYTRMSVEELRRRLDDFGWVVAEYDHSIGCADVVEREVRGMFGGKVGALTDAFSGSALELVLTGRSIPLDRARPAGERRTSGGWHGAGRPRMEERIAPLLGRLEKIDPGDRVAVWGTGEVSTALLRCSNLLAGRSLAFFDRRHGASVRFFGHAVKAPDDLRAGDFDWYVIGSLAFEPEIRRELEARGVAGECIIGSATG